MKKLKYFISYAWRPAFVYGLAILMVAALLFIKLESLTPSYAPLEATTVQHLQNRDLGLRTIIESPLYLPYDLGVYVLEKLHLKGIYIARSISALMGLIAVICFYYIIRRWHNLRVSLFATILFATSSSFLHVARIADVHASVLLLLLLIASGAWLNDTKRRGVMPLLLAGVASGLLLYIPGLLWFIVLGLIWQRRRLRRAFNAMRARELALIISISLLVATPAIMALIKQPLFILALLGLPDHPIAISEIARNLISILRELFIHGPANSTYWLQGTPLLDAFTAAMFIIGLYSYFFRLALDRAKLLLLGVVLSLILISVGGVGNMILLLPFVYLIVAAGIAYMLQQWFRIFPRNPIARTLGVSLITIAVAASAFYNLNHYFIAWAKAPETKQTFSQHL